MKRKLHNQSLNFTSTKGSLEVYELEGSSRNPHLSIFNLSSIVASTDNFSPTNKLGQGGFGPGFKVQLQFIYNDIVDILHVFLSISYSIIVRV